MSLTTFSVFYYDFEFTDDFQYIDFDEGSGELTATVAVGSYTPTEMAEQIQDAMNAVGTLTYVVTFNRSDRTFTIESTAGNFDLLVTSGSSANKAYSKFGFTGADRTGDDEYTGVAAGFEYIPQFILQDHIPTENFQSLIDPSINRSSTGKVEVIRFGVEKFLQCNIKFATDLAMDGRVIRNNPDGVNDLIALMQYLMTKKPAEYMPDKANRNTFQKLILESTGSERDGSGFKLKELYDQGLPNFFETGNLVFRLIEG